MLDARALLGWSRERLAAWSETTSTFILTYETEGRVMTTPSRDRNYNAMIAVQTALEHAGVEFTNKDEPGVKLRRTPN